jgi:hypothetical protein
MSQMQRPMTFMDHPADKSIGMECATETPGLPEARREERVPVM